MKKNMILKGVGIAFSLVALIMAVISFMGNKKTAFFDYNLVYNSCDLKKDLEKDLEKVVSMRKSELDSMKLELTLLSNQVKSGNTNQNELDQFENLKNKFLTIQNRYEEENIRLKEGYFTQIREEINEKAKSFAEKLNMDYFFSAVGDGSLMYAKESEDVTDEFLEYLNNQ